MSTIPRRNHLKTDSRDREATRTMGASRDFTTGIDTGAPTALRERPSTCLLYTSPSPRDQRGSRMPSSA